MIKNYKKDMIIISKNIMGTGKILKHLDKEKKERRYRIKLELMPYDTIENVTAKDVLEYFIKELNELRDRIFVKGLKDHPQQGIMIIDSWKEYNQLKTGSQ